MSAEMSWAMGLNDDLKFFRRAMGLSRPCGGVHRGPQRVYPAHHLRGAGRHHARFLRPSSALALQRRSVWFRGPRGA